MYILITRQLEQSKKFSSLLKKKNIKNFILPAINIKNIKPKAHDLENLHKSNFIIFTSQNSVTSLMENLTPKNLRNKKIAAIGKSTKQILNDMKIHVDICPKSDFTSESLLQEIKENAIINKKILVIKGLGGRTYLHEELLKENTVYDDLVIYERHLPEGINKFSPSVLKDITHICITSIDVLNNFLVICNILKIKIEKHVIFVAGNQRIANECRNFFSFNKVLISLNPSNGEMLKTILN
ncbi:MAG: uroporphyrinogen-III synthase [Gammaproteobacteria bacterium]|jgi:uroporphyrinogen-III synthase|nr:uroporphyrinogen-III synthase [Gammaproteobacteria bacterium]MBT7603627.1 uroporphyrinogen-III synthase [Gammaproteobacteria bacterium]